MKRSPMRILRSVMKLLGGIVLFLVGLALLISLFELPLRLATLILGPLHPDLIQVYTLIEIGLIVCILIFGLPSAYAWFNRWWNGRYRKPAEHE